MALAAVIAGCRAEPEVVGTVEAEALATTAAWTVEGNQASAWLGRVVSSAGDVNGDGYDDVLVCALGYDSSSGTDSGAVFIFFGSPSGPSTVADWSGFGTAPSQFYGTAGAGAGDLNGDGYDDIAIGTGQTDEVHVYHGSPGGLPTTPDVVITSPTGNGFGQALDGAGDVNGDGFADLVVGEFAWMVAPAVPVGAAWLYLGSASGVSTSVAWSAFGAVENGRFGSAVKGAGDVNGDGYDDVLVAERHWNSGGNTTQIGRAHLHLGGASGLASGPTWTVAGTQNSQTFGESVDGAGDVNGDGYADIIVGVHGFGLGDWYGKAIVYYGDSGGPSTTPAWSYQGGNSWFLGNSVSSAGDVNGDGFADVIVGASQANAGDPNEGQALVFLGSAAGPQATAAWTAESDQAEAYFGTSVAGAGDVNGDGFADVIAGATGWDNAQQDEGAAWLYYGESAGLATSEAWSTESNQVEARAGWGLNNVGDVDGDGFDDVVIGAQGYDAGELNEGAAFLHLGSATGLQAAPAWTGEGNQINASYGEAIAGGDFNGDGYADVVVGAADHSNGQNREGRAYVYLGSAAGLAGTAAWTAESNVVNAEFGYSVASVGDTNRDGYDDLLIGADHYTSGQFEEGAVFLFLGSPSGPSATADWMWESNQMGANAGSAVGGADLNGDGYADLLVGAASYSNGQNNEGAVFGFYGSPTGPTSTAPDWTAESNQPVAQMGWAVASGGDLNGDGFEDVLAGVPQHENGETYEGGVYVYFGSATGPPTTPSLIFESNQANAQYGAAVDGAGDVDGDGYGDLVIGAFFYDNGTSEEGAAFLHEGTASGPAPAATWTTESDQTFALHGYTTSTAGDVNGDGYADVLAAAIHYDAGETDEGRAYLYLGNGGDGTGLHPAPARALAFQPGTTTPIAPGLRSTSQTSFDVQALASSPFGRADVKLQIEAKAAGTPFDGTGLTTSAAWTDSTLQGTTLTETVGSLAAETAYHWRARVLYHPRHGLPQSHGPWLYGGRSGHPEGTHVVTACAVDTDADGQCDSWDLDDDNDNDPDVTDCDDTNPLVFTGATEVCDALDNDCDTTVDDGFDTDTDGVTTCGPDGVAGTADDDCDDNDILNFPGNPEACDGQDNDCSGSADFVATTDDLGGEVDTDVDGVLDCLDCADADPLNFPGNTEACDGQDNDCLNGADFVATTNDLGGEVDTDVDGVLDCLDCDDGDPLNFPGNTEVCDEQDNDCLNGADFPGETTDADNDGSVECLDCDDTDVANFPGNPEVCDAADNDCDGAADNGFDTDGDGFTTCGADGVASTTDDDCDDIVDSTYPGAEEFCDPADSDCDGSLVDEFLDTDGDLEPDCIDTDDDDDGIPDDQEGDGDVDGDGIPDSLDLDDDDGPLGDSDGDGDPNETDCDPDDDTVGHGLPELCDELDIDNDCDPTTDQDTADVDGDDATPCDGDCDDTDPTVFEGADEVCDGVDNDCDGDIDEDSADRVEWWADRDGDGYGDPDASLGFACEPPDASADNALDCNDAEPDAHPDAVEICGDAVDNDCDGTEADGQDDPECWPEGCADCQSSTAAPRASLGALLMFALIALRRRPRSHPLLLALAVALLLPATSFASDAEANRQIAFARQELSEAKYERALSSAESALRLCPTCYDAVVLKALAYEGLGNLELAEALLLAHGELAGSQTPEADEALARVRGAKQGKRGVRAQRPTPVAASPAPTTKLDPAPYRVRVTEALEAGQCSAARAAAAELTLASPDEASGWRLVGDAARCSGDLRGAVVAYRRYKGEGGSEGSVVEMIDSLAGNLGRLEVQVATDSGAVPRLRLEHGSEVLTPESTSPSTFRFVDLVPGEPLTLSVAGRGLKPEMRVVPPVQPGATATLALTPEVIGLAKIRVANYDPKRCSVRVETDAGYEPADPGATYTVTAGSAIVLVDNEQGTREVAVDLPKNTVVDFAPERYLPTALTVVGLPAGSEVRVFVEGPGGDIVEQTEGIPSALGEIDPTTGVRVAPPQRFLSLRGGSGGVFLTHPVLGNGNSTVILERGQVNATTFQWKGLEGVPKVRTAYEAWTARREAANAGTGRTIALGILSGALLGAGGGMVGAAFAQDAIVDQTKLDGIAAGQAGDRAALDAAFQANGAAATARDALFVVGPVLGGVGAVGFVLTIVSGGATQKAVAEVGEWDPASVR